MAKPSSKCSQCGANINTKTMQCEYCGTGYASIHSEDKAVDNKSTIVLSTSTIIRTLNKLNPSLIMILPVVIFMTVWCSIALGMAGFVATMDVPLVAIAPLGMFAIGLSVMITVVRTATKGRITGIINLCESNNWREALTLAGSKDSSNYHLAYVLIQVYYFKSYDNVQEKLRALTPVELGRTIFISTAWTDIADMYNIRVDTTVSRYGNFNHFS